MHYYYSAVISGRCGDWLESREIWLALMGVSAWRGVPSFLLTVSWRDVVLDVDTCSPVLPSSAAILEDDVGVLENWSTDIIPGPVDGTKPTRFGRPSLKNRYIFNITKTVKDQKEKLRDI